MIQNRLHRLWQQGPQPARLFYAHLPASLPGGNVAGELAHHLPKRQVGIANPGKGVAIAAGDDQIGVGLLRAAGEFSQQRRFSPPGPPVTKTICPFPIQRLGKIAV
jgi:hypothetical protein